MGLRSFHFQLFFCLAQVSADISKVAKILHISEYNDLVILFHWVPS